MKKIFVAALFLTNFAFAEEASTQPAAPAPASNKITTKDAKKSCKEDGKKGAELIKCMKDKKDEK